MRNDASAPLLLLLRCVWIARKNVEYVTAASQPVIQRTHSHDTALTHTHTDVAHSHSHAMTQSRKWRTIKGQRKSPKWRSRRTCNRRWIAQGEAVATEMAESIALFDILAKPASTDNALVVGQVVERVKDLCGVGNHFVIFHTKIFSSLESENAKTPRYCATEIERN